MANNAKTVKRNMPMSIACVLLCLVLITVYLVCGLYAKYTTSAEGSDASVAAKFTVTEDNLKLGNSLVFDFAPGTHTQNIQVTNGSEVAIGYTITITNETNNIPLQFAIGTPSTIDGATTTLGGASGTYNMEPGDTETFALKVFWDQTDALDYMGMVDLISVEVEAVQID